MPPCPYLLPLLLGSQIPVPDKFHGDHNNFPSFMNQCGLFLMLQLLSLSTDQIQVGLIIIILLTREILAWAFSLLETSSPLLDQFEEFV